MKNDKNFSAISVTSLCQTKSQCECDSVYCSVGEYSAHAAAYALLLDRVVTCYTESSLAHSFIFSLLFPTLNRQLLHNFKAII